MVPSDRLRGRTDRTLRRTGRLALVPDDDAELEVGSVHLTRPRWWFEHDEEFAEAMRVAARWDDDFGRIERRRAEDADVREPPDEAPRRLTLTVEEAAAALGISRAFAYESVNRGDIPSIRIGRRILVPKAALDRMLSGETG